VVSEERRAAKHPSIAAAWVRHIFAARPLESCSLRNGGVQDFVLKWEITGNFVTGLVRGIA